MALISQRISSMPPSETLAMTQIANELAEAGKDVIKLILFLSSFSLNYSEESDFWLVLHFLSTMRIMVP